MYNIIDFPKKEDLNKYGKQEVIYARSSEAKCTDNFFFYYRWRKNILGAGPRIWSDRRPIEKNNI